MKVPKSLRCTIQLGSKLVLPDLVTMHCPKNYLINLLKTDSVTVGAAAAVENMSGFWARYVDVNKSRTEVYTIYSCIRSTWDNLGFYAEIQIIFGTVCRLVSKQRASVLCKQ